jgi:hypothetical protein
MERCPFQSIRFCFSAGLSTGMAMMDHYFLCTRPSEFRTDIPFDHRQYKIHRRGHAGHGARRSPSEGCYPTEGGRRAADRFPVFPRPGL